MQNTSGNQTGPATLRDLLENGAPQHAAIRVPDGPTITYDSLRRQVDSLAEQLRAQGISKDDRVALVLPNSAEAIISFLGVATAATAAPLNPAYKADEFRFYLEDTNARALVGDGRPEADEARGAAPESTLHIGVQIDDRGEVSFSNGIGGSAGGDGPPGSADTALILHTSGTTSRPKRVPLAHQNLVASVRNIVETYSLTPDDVSLCVMPLFHVHGIVASTLATLASGGTIVVPGRFNALGFWRVAREYGATWYTAVPSMHQALLSRARSSEDREQYAGMRFIRSCSAALPSAIMLEMEERFGVPVLEAYGMTEASHQMSSNPLPPGEASARLRGPRDGSVHRHHG